MKILKEILLHGLREINALVLTLISIPMVSINGVVMSIEDSLQYDFN